MGCDEQTSAGTGRRTLPAATDGGRYGHGTVEATAAMLQPRAANTRSKHLSQTKLPPRLFHVKGIDVGMWKSLLSKKTGQSQSQTTSATDSSPGFSVYVRTFSAQYLPSRLPFGRPPIVATSHRRPSPAIAGQRWPSSANSGLWRPVRQLLLHSRRPDKACSASLSQNPVKSSLSIHEFRLSGERIFHVACI